MDGSHSGHVAAGLTSVRQILWAEYSFRSTDTQADYRQCTANALHQPNKCSKCQTRQACNIFVWQNPFDLLQSQIQASIKQI